jgi:hypothetical protein
MLKRKKAPTFQTELCGRSLWECNGSSSPKAERVITHRFAKSNGVAQWRRLCLETEKPAQGAGFSRLRREGAA